MKFIIALTSALLVAMGAQAQQRCGPYERMADGLAGEQFQEQPHYLGQLGDFGVMELWVNNNTGTFTIVGRPTSDPATGCILITGSKFRESTTPKHVPGKGA